MSIHCKFLKDAIFAKCKESMTCNFPSKVLETWNSLFSQVCQSKFFLHLYEVSRKTGWFVSNLKRLIWFLYFEYKFCFSIWSKSVVLLTSRFTMKKKYQESTSNDLIFETKQKWIWRNWSSSIRWIKSSKRLILWINLSFY